MNIYDSATIPVIKSKLKDSSFTFLFTYSFFMTFVAFFFSYILFNSEIGIISIFLVVFSLIPIVNNLFNNNKIDIWHRKIHALKANFNLGLSIFFIFFGIFFSYTLISLFLSPENNIKYFHNQLGNFKYIYPGFQISNLQFDNFLALLEHNACVLLIALFFSLFYRIGGILLVIVWNASAWGIIIGFINLNLFLSGNIKFTIFHLIILYLIFFLHLILESLGYILSAMSGYFISRAFIKYFKNIDNLIKVSKASILIFLLSLHLLIISAIIESFITPYLLNKLLT